MQISRFAKTVVYLIATALITAVSVWLQGSLMTHYGRSVIMMFIAAICLLGAGIYSYRHHTHKAQHADHRVDSIFVLIVGAVYLILSVVMFVWFNFDMIDSAEGYFAVNLCAVIWTVLPAVFWLRTVMLAFSTQAESAACRIGAKVAALLLVVVMGVCMATGHMMKLVHFDENASEQSQSEQSADEDFYL